LTHEGSDLRQIFSQNSDVALAMKIGFGLERTMYLCDILDEMAFMPVSNAFVDILGQELTLSRSVAYSVRPARHLLR
jgi:hypothetical protein